jgi:hypothetical protein
LIYNLRVSRVDFLFCFFFTAVKIEEERTCQDRTSSEENSFVCGGVWLGVVRECFSQKTKI